MRAGLLTHAMLQCLTTLRDRGVAPPGASEPPKTLASATVFALFDLLAQRMRASSTETAAARAQAEALLAAPQFAHWFDPQQFRAAHNEMEILTGGEIKRLDRLVEFDSVVWVLDYKARVTAEHEGAYQAQLADYVAAITPLYPAKPVQGALIDLATGIAIPLKS